MGESLPRTTGMVVAAWMSAVRRCSGTRLHVGQIRPAGPLRVGETLLVQLLSISSIY